MKIKIDENMPVDVINILKNAGHDTYSVYSEEIEGCSDRQLITICKKEKRLLITLDNDFSNIFFLPPNGPVNEHTDTGDKNIGQGQGKQHLPAEAHELIYPDAGECPTELDDNKY